MNSLTTQPLSGLLEKLFADAEKTHASMRQELARLTPAERAASEQGPGDYKTFYMTRAKDVYLSVSRETGTLLYMLARSVQARSVVEFGTSFGISTLYLAAAMKDNGGGRVIGTEFEPSKVSRARENIAAAGLSEFVEVRAGDALETLGRDLPQTIDLVLLDGAKSLYSPVLGLIAARLRPGALVVADNAEMAPEYIQAVRKPGSGYVSTPCMDDVELSLKL
jgi:predicted O-methyltransferase YrrM